MKKAAIRAFFAVLVLPFAWIAVAAPPATGARGEPLIVAAAASLRPVFRELGRIFADREGSPPIFVFGASGSLARQMEHGAPFDVLASAEEAWVVELAGKGVIEPDSVTPYARGRLAVVFAETLGIGNAVAPIGREELARLLLRGVIYVAIANPAHAPYGVAAREALRAAKVWRRLEGKLVYGENVRQALSFVETGNAEAALVAQSILVGSRLPWLPVDERLYRPIRQAVGVGGATKRRTQAQRFVALLFAPEGRRILTRFGFVPLPEKRPGRGR